MKKIFEPIRLNNLTLRNRLIRSATWEALALKDGSITDEILQIYSQLAKGGIGAIITGFTGVASNDFYFPAMMRLSSDNLIEQYKLLTETAHKEQCPIITQLALGAYYCENNIIEPDQMTQNEIRNVIELFTNSATRAKQANFDGIQIHSAHFFFLSRFISPAVNHRSDEWGGDTNNRTKILVEIIQEIHHKIPNFHISIKINSSDFVENGIDENESLKICKILADNGIDSIEVSGNGTSVSNIVANQNEGYFVDFASKLSNMIDTPIFVVGGLRSKQTMEKILNSSKIIGLSLSRPLVCEPDLPHKLQTGSSDISKCISCNACYSTQGHRCIFSKRNGY